MTQATKEKRTEKEEPTEPRKITLEEWLAEGRELFGDDPLRWRFVCPNCKHIQTMGDFKELRELKIFKGELDVQQAYYSCIGRFDPRIPEEKIGTIGGEEKPYCDYTMGGLFHFVKTIVIDGDGKENKVFEFHK